MATPVFKRVLALLALCLALGGAALYLTPQPHRPPRGPASGHERDVAPASAVTEGDRRTAAAANSSLQRQLMRLIADPAFGPGDHAGVEALLQQASRDELESLARMVAALPDIAGPRFALETALARYAQLDRRAAVELAGDVGAPDALVAKLHRGWARTDPDAALRALRAYSEPRASLVAVELVDELGGGAAVVERVLAAAPRREAALTRVAARAVDDDVGAALRTAAELADADLRVDFTAAVMREWARADGEAMLEYVIRLPPGEQSAALDAGGLEAFSQLPPERMLELAQRLPADSTDEVRRIALMGLARNEPLAAMRYADALPLGPARSEALVLAMRGYAQADPEAALAWAQALQPPEPAMVAAALAGFARVDPDRALDLVLAMSEQRPRIELLQSLVASGALGADRMAALASRLPNDVRERGGLHTILATWARRDPERALDWLLANPDRAAPGSFAEVAESLGRTDAAVAAESLRRIPTELRPLWIKSAAAGYAYKDPAAAAAWVARYEGDDGYSAAVATVARRMARADPEAGAALLVRVDVAGVDEARDAANEISQRWVRDHAAAARAWALRFPSGEVRDAALAPVLRADVARTGAMEAGLLGSFSNEPARQHAIADAVIALADRDAAAARRLADQYLADPALRREMERFLP